MSLKNDVNNIKKEFTTEENYIESVFKIEKLFKKYKIAILGLSSIIIIAVISFYISSYFEEQNKIQANTAFNALLKNPNDKEAIAVLQAKNPKLYEMSQYKLDDSKENNLEFFRELALYTQAINEKNIDKLSLVTQKQDFILKDFALFNKALLQAKESKFTDAKETLKLIDSQSEVTPMVKMLEHFLLTK